MILMDPKKTITSFDEFLHSLGLKLDAVIAGGAALALLGIISRPTRDCDVIHPYLPGPIVEAAKRFARHRSSQGDMLDETWLNNDAISITNDLPSGWMDRLQVVYQGPSITLNSLGREDLLRTKVFALCDRTIDLQDCIALAPSKKELEGLLPWLEAQDGNPDWPMHVRAVVDDLRRRMGHGI